MHKFALLFFPPSILIFSPSSSFFLSIYLFLSLSLSFSLSMSLFLFFHLFLSLSCSLFLSIYRLLKIFVFFSLFIKMYFLIVMRLPLPPLYISLLIPNIYQTKRLFFYFWYFLYTNLSLLHRNKHRGRNF